MGGGGGGGGGEGGQGLKYWGGGGAKGRQIPSRHMTRLLINQCQIITFLILKSDIIENSRIELRGIYIVLPVPSNQIKVTFIILSFNFVHL